MAKKKLITSDEAVPNNRQHRKPCSDCPWARDSLPGWTGNMPPEEWLACAHGETLIDCHTLIGPQCAGAAIYRANISKLPRDKSLLVLTADKEKVFSGPTEFLIHHAMNPRRNSCATSQGPLPDH